MAKKQAEALASLPGRSGVKAAEALSGITEAINNSWVPIRVAYVVGWVSQNLWTLVLGIGGLLYM